jgi:hypothetical protein
MTLLLLALSTANAQDIPSAKVVMPWSDFKTLYEKGKAPVEKPEPAPQHWSINRAEYNGKVVEDGKSAVFNVDMKVQVHKDKGWITVPLAPTSVALKSAKMGGKDAPIFISGGWYTLVTDKKGTLDIDLEIAASVFEANGQSSMSFPMAPSGGTVVKLDVPTTSDLEFTVAQAHFLKDEARGSVRRMEAILPATGNLAISWQREITTEEIAQEGRVYAEVHSLVGVAEGVLTGHSDVNYTIVHQGVETLFVALPSDVTILDVKGNGIREWTVSADGGHQTVQVDLNFEAEGAYRLMVDYEVGLADDQVALTVPNLQVGGVERVKGFVGVAALSTLEVVDGDTSGVRKVDVRELPGSVLGRTDQPVLLGYKYREADWNIPLTVTQHEEIDVLVTIIDTAEAISMVTPDGKVMGRASWYVRNNRRQFMRLDMPEGAEIWSVKVAGKAVKPARDDSGQVLVPLVRSQTGGGSLAAFAVEVIWVEQGVSPDEKGVGSIDLALPTTDVPITYYRWSVYVPWKAKVKKKSLDSSLRHVEWFNTPVTPEGEYLDLAGQVAQQQTYQAQTGAVQGGVAPVEVAMPVDGQAYYFEKLLVLDEELTMHLDYKGLTKD